MAKRMILMLVFMTILVAGLGFVKFRQFQAMADEFAAMQPPPEAVTTIVAQPGRVAGDAQRDRHGRRRAGRHGERRPARHRRADRVRVGPGGARRATCWCVLDTRQEQAQLAAAEAQRELARAQLRAHAGAARRAASSRSAEFDRADGRRTGRRDARVGEIRATIERKTIRAPFSGVLGIRQVNLGQYLAGGDAGRAAAVAESDLRELRRAAAGDRRRCASGRTVRVTADDAGGVEFTGRVTAIDSVVDEATRNVQVQATLANPRRQAAARACSSRREVALGASAAVIALPASAISYAPYGDSVFVVDRHEGPERARPIAACASSS